MLRAPLLSLLAATAAFADTAPADAVPPSPEQQQDDFNRHIGLKNGPLAGDMGVATITVPEGFVFTDGAGAKKWAQLTTNPVSGKEIGLMGPADGKYLVLFEFDDVGFVKDDDKDDLDADELLESFKEGTASFNEERVKAGVPPMNVLGWEQVPAYNEAVHALEWCVRAESGGTPSINFNTRLLGRRGYVGVTLMFGGEVTLADVLPGFRALLKGFTYKTGETYSEFKSGDRIAEYGLAALVAGGGVALAAKTGLLGKLGLLLAKGGKAIVLGVIAVVGVVGSFFKKIFGRKQE
jgi:uncharacterized membrane-anchored protein